MSKIPRKREFEDAYVKIVRDEKNHFIKGDLEILKDKSVPDDAKVTYLIIANEINRARYMEGESWPEMVWLSGERELCPSKVEKHLKLLADKGYIEEALASYLSL